MQKKHPDLIQNVDNSLAIELMSKYSIKGFDFKLFWNSNKENFIKRYGVPNRVEEIADKVVNSNLSFEESIKLISDFKKLKDISTNELKGITVLESILTSSNTYWNSSQNSKPGTPAIIADGIVGLVFCYTGPFGFFAAASASVFVNETEP